MAVHALVPYMVRDTSAAATSAASRKQSAVLYIACPLCSSLRRWDKGGINAFAGQVVVRERFNGAKGQFEWGPKRLLLGDAARLLLEPLVERVQILFQRLHAALRGDTWTTSRTVQTTPSALAANSSMTRAQTVPLLFSRTRLAAD